MQSLIGLFIQQAFLEVSGCIGISFIRRRITAEVRYIHPVLVIQVIFEGSTEMMHPPFFPNLFLIPDIMYLPLQRMARIQIDLRHRLVVGCSIHHIHCQLGSCIAEVRIRIPVVEILVPIIGRDFTGKGIIGCLLQDDVDSSSTYMVFRRCVIHHLSFFYPIDRRIP